MKIPHSSSQRLTKSHIVCDVPHSSFLIGHILKIRQGLITGAVVYEQQFLGGAYNPQLGAAIALVMMVIVVLCMWVMNRFGEGEEQAVVL